MANSPAPTPIQVSIDDDPVKGDKDAPVTIVEFSDFQCPFCQRFYQQTLPSIEENYVKTGKVKIVFRDFPLSFHQNAQKAAEAAECADDQGKFWQYHDMLFEKGSGDGTGLATNDLKSYAQTLGLNTATFNNCLDSGKYTSEVQKDQADGTSYGVRGTPAFFVNGQLISGAQPYANFQQVIDAELAKSNNPSKIITTGGVVNEEVTSCNNGCLLNSKCIPFGQRTQNNNQNVYCSLQNAFEVQKTVNESCQNSYECLSDQCSNGKCIDLGEKIDENSNILQKILDWLNNLFG